MQFTTKEIFPGRVIAHLNTRHKANCESTVNDFDTMNQQMEIHRNATRMRYQRIVVSPFHMSMVVLLRRFHHGRDIYWPNNVNIRI